MTESIHMFGFVCCVALAEELPLFEVAVDDAVELLVLVCTRLAGSLNGNRDGSLNGTVGLGRAEDDCRV